MTNTSPTPTGPPLRNGFKRLKVSPWTELPLDERVYTLHNERLWCHAREMEEDKVILLLHPAGKRTFKYILKPPDASLIRCMGPSIYDGLSPTDFTSRDLDYVGVIWDDPKINEFMQSFRDDDQEDGHL